MRKHTFLIAAMLISLTAPLKAEPGIEFFSPQGTVKSVRQATARFSEPMVPFGDPRGLLEPFTINCPAKGTAHWADGRNWVFDFENDLPAGIQCEFTLKPELKTLAGNELAAAPAFSFNTGGPAILGSEPYEGSTDINEDQIFILKLNAAPELQSVSKNAYFSVEGIPEKIGVQIISGSQRESILRSTPYFIRDNKRPERVLLLASKQRFPPGAKTALVWGRGIKASASPIGTTQDQVLRFVTRPEFTATLSCERVNSKSGCLPFRPIRLNFSAPARWSQAKNIFLADRSGGKWKPQTPADDSEYVYGISFKPPFPPLAQLRMNLPGNLQDDSNRILSNRNKFPLDSATGDFPPLAKFPAHFGILEAKADPVLPFTVRNIEPQVAARVAPLGDSNTQNAGLTGKLLGRIYKTTSYQPADIMSWLAKTSRPEYDENAPNWSDSILAAAKLPIKQLYIPKPNGDKAFEVMGIPLKQPGIYIVELESRILGNTLYNSTSTMFVPSMALVTDMSVHFKWGRESSLVWVTSLDKGAPVSGARVEISNCEGKKIWEGRTDDSGAAITAALPAEDALPSCATGKWSSTKRLFVAATAGNDYSFVLSDWDDGIEPWRFEIPYGYRSEPETTTHAVFDRMLLHAGETVHMKHVVRNKTMQGFSIPPQQTLGKTAVITHTGSGQAYELPLEWAKTGTAQSEWDIPAQAKTGVYSVMISSAVSGVFRVEEFRVPLMRGSIQPPKEDIIGSQTVELNFNVNYLSGGAAGGLPVKVRTQVKRDTAPAFEDFAGFVFGNGPARSGEPGATDEELPLRTTELDLDAGGTGRIQVKDVPAVTTPMKVLSELEFSDPNGEIQTVSSETPVWPAQWFVGLKPDSWALSRNNLKFQAAVADIKGRPVVDAVVKLKLLQRKTFSHRKRLVGGFYSYQNSYRLTDLGPVCPGLTDKNGLMSCEVPSPVSGNVIVQASVFDEQGNEAVANTDIWVAGEDEWWFSADNSDRMDLLPERKRYEPGETAALQVRLPFKDATALVTVEREGVLDYFVQPLDRNRPVVSIPVKPNYSPNVFVSVLAVRGRSGEPQPTALVDLGRPAFKLGMAELKVGWQSHELKVKVTPQNEIYKVRQTARAAIEVKPEDGKPLPRGAEAAVAVVDEGLLELMPNSSWKLLDAMMGRRSLSVETATAQMQVVGKRHYGLKALPQGGGGGATATRELFDTLLLWQPSLRLDAQGRAEIEIPLNDSITSFRIVAVANAGAGHFGTGAASIRTTQDLSIFSGLSPVVRGGDRYRAYFTLRNASVETSTITLTAVVEGLRQQPQPLQAILAPQEARELAWDINVPVDADKLQYRITARDENGNEDSLTVAQKVLSPAPVRVFHSTLAQVEEDLSLSVKMPSGAFPGLGGVKVALSPTLASGADSIAQYMSVYPYSCLEQQVSKAVAMRQEDAWARAMAALPSYMDSDGLLKYFPNSAYGSEVLTAYVLAIAHEAGWQIPETQKSAMKEGLYRLAEGKLLRWSSFPTADLTLRKLAALEALSRYDAGSAPRLTAAAGAIVKEPNLWPTSAVLDWAGILKKISLPNSGQMLNEAENILRSRLNFHGATMGFSTEEHDGLWWLMTSADVNSVRMVLSHLKDAQWRQDMPRLMRGALGRQKQGHWDLTLANAWGRLCLEKFGQEFEKAPVTGKTDVELDKQDNSMHWGKRPEGGTLDFSWPDGRETLKIKHVGTGRPWAMISSLAALPPEKSFSSGYKIKKTWLPLERKTKKTWSRGDVVRVRLELQAQSDMTWVAVNDPVPAGTTILGSGLGRDSKLLTQGEKTQGGVWPAYEERTFDSYRAYYEYVPKGSWTLEYTIRLNNEGRFGLPATRAEAMYAPEMFGELPNDAVEIKP